MGIVKGAAAHSAFSSEKTYAGRRAKDKKAFNKCFERYGWDGVYTELKKKHYTRSFSGMVYAAKRMGLTEKPKTKKRTKR